MAKCLQGKFTPNNPIKYVGDSTQIIYRSSWELKLFLWCDSNSSILHWASEEIVIPYFCPTDDRMHRYFPDVAIKFKTAKGEIRKALIEVKPYTQTLPPKVPKRGGTNSKRFLTETLTYSKNRAKWEAAKIWCAKNGFEFMIADEYMLGIAKRPR